MKIIIKDDMGNVVAEREFSKEESSLNLSVDKGQLKVQTQEASQPSFVGCYH
jgi:hypothetical protein